MEVTLMGETLIRVELFLTLFVTMPILGMLIAIWRYKGKR